MLNAVPVVGLEQAPSTREPPGRLDDVSAKEKVVTDPEGAAHGSRRVAGIQMQAMRPLQARAIVIVAPEHVGRPSESFKSSTPRDAA